MYEKEEVSPFHPPVGTFSVSVTGSRDCRLGGLSLTSVTRIEY